MVHSLLPEVPFWGSKNHVFPQEHTPAMWWIEILGSLPKTRCQNSSLLFFFLCTDSFFYVLVILFFMYGLIKRSSIRSKLESEVKINKSVHKEHG